MLKNSAADPLQGQWQELGPQPYTVDKGWGAVASGDKEGFAYEVLKGKGDEAWININPSVSTTTFNDVAKLLDPTLLFK